MLRAISRRHPRGAWLILQGVRRRLCTPSAAVDVCRERRQRLLRSYIPEPEAIVLLSGSRTRYMSGQIFYPFHQDPDMLHLTGMGDPDAAAIMVKSGGTERLTAFVRGQTASEAAWEGARISRKDTVALFGADEGRWTRDFDAVLAATVAAHPRAAIYADTDSATDHATQHASVDIPAALSRLCSGATTRPPQPLRPVLHRFRVQKTAAEIACMRKAAHITGDAMAAVMRATARGTLHTERDVHALFEYECRRRGAEQLAYVPVVSGRPETGHVIHYTRNNRPLARDGGGGLVLLDGGAQVDGYAADVTRTFPVSGRFTGPQRRLYEALLDVQVALIDRCCVGTSLDSLLRDSLEMVRQRVCVDLFGMDGGGTTGTYIEYGPSHRLAQLIYPHHIGHYLGRDVHDCAAASSGYLTPAAAAAAAADYDNNNNDDINGPAKQRSPRWWRAGQLVPGMCLTVEPGVYLPPLGVRDAEFRQVPAEYRGISIRIEDDVVVGREAPDVLSATSPKTVRDIEALMSVH